MLVRPRCKYNYDRIFNKVILCISCTQVLERYIKLEPILSSEEDQPVTVRVGFDPAAIKLVGNVTREPPIRGLLRHRGWRVTGLTLPSLPQGSGKSMCMGCFGSICH